MLTGSVLVYEDNFHYLKHLKSGRKDAGNAWPSVTKSGF